MTAHALVSEANRHAFLKEELLRRFPSLLEDDQALSDTLEGISSLREAVEAVYISLEEDTMLLVGVTTRVEELIERGDRIKSRIVYKREAILAAMLDAGETKFELAGATISTPKTPQSVVVIDESLVPAYLKIQPEAPPARVDKRMVAALLKAKSVVPGCALSNGGHSLSIRTK